MIVACFFLAATSGLAWIFPTVSWLPASLGTPQRTRALHPFLGIAVFAGFCVMFVRFVRDDLPAASDRIWFRNIGRVKSGDPSQKLRIGKHKAGQKALFRTIMAATLVRLVSGLVL